MNTWSPWWQISLALVSGVIFWWSLKKSRNHQFYSDTFALSVLGIFVWGDGLILGPFWLFASLLFIVLSPLMITRFILLFYAIRFAFEVVYWINHQVAQKKYMPPLFRHISWLKPQEGAILYQILTTCVCLLATFGLLLSFTLS